MATAEGISFEEFVASALPRLVRFAGWVTGPGGDPEDLVQDALVPAPSPTATPSATASTPTTTAASGSASTGTRPAAPTATSGAAVPPAASASPSSSPAAAPIVFDGYRFYAPDLADPPANVTRRDSLDAAWPLQPCDPAQAYPTDSRRLDFALAATAQDTAFVSAVAVYPNEATARAVLAGFSDAVGRCGRTTEPVPAGSGLTRWAAFTPPALGQESIGLLATTYDAGEFQPGDSFVVVREGNVVLVSEVYSDRAGASFTDAERQAQVADLAGQEFARLVAAITSG